MVKTKRKVESHSDTKEPFSKVTKTDKTILKKENIPLQKMAKPDLLKYCLELEEMNKKLQNENIVVMKEKEDSIHVIKVLEESVKVLEMKNKILQQQEEKFTYTCSDCEYKSDCVHCFSDHEHDSQDVNDQEKHDLNFQCYYCDETFSSLMSVMNHTKILHVEKTKHCTNFLDGACRFNERCWYLHDEKFKQSNPTYTCNHCDSNFRTKTQLMHHKKLFHIEKVLKCSNEKCKYGSEKCWFLHAENIEQAYKNAKNANLDNVEKYDKKVTDDQT